MMGTLFVGLCNVAATASSWPLCRADVGIFVVMILVRQGSRNWLCLNT